MMHKVKMGNRFFSGDEGMVLGAMIRYDYECPDLHSFTTDENKATLMSKEAAKEVAESLSWFNNQEYQVV